MELTLTLKETREGIKSEENVTFPEDVLLVMTPAKLWAHYETILNRIEESHEMFKQTQIKK